jgi:hypothetical protein
MAGNFADANRRIQEARIALQNGRSMRAAELAGAALAFVPSPNVSTASEIRTDSIVQGKYNGAKVLNARGVRVGEIRRIENDEAVMSIGGVAGLFGFLDFGGQEVRVPLDHVLLGEPRSIGSTFVVLPSLRSAPDEIRDQLAAGFPRR